METFLGILVLVALAGGIYLVQRLVGRGVAAVEGVVTGNTRTRGMSAVHLKLDFAAPVAGPDLVERLVETLELSDKRNQLGIRIAGIADDRSAIMIEEANWAGVAQWQYALDTDPAPAGCTGFGTVVKWMETEGRVHSTENIERIHKHVRSAVERVNGSVTESSNQSGARS